MEPRLVLQETTADMVRFDFRKLSDGPRESMLLDLLRKGKCMTAESEDSYLVLYSYFQKAA